MTPDTGTPRATTAASDNDEKPLKTVDSEDLFEGSRELVIRHKSDRYVLRITRQGKLILNK